MLEKEEIEGVNKILSCDNCPTSYACEACDITWTDKDLIKKYISKKKCIFFVQNQPALSKYQKNT